MKKNTITRRELLGLIPAGMLTFGMQKELYAAQKEQGAPELSFGVVTDAQYGDFETQGVRYYRDSRKKMEECVNAMNRHTPGFVIHLGDFIDRDFKSFAPMLSVFQRLQMPAYHVLGNHDFAVDENSKGRIFTALSLDKRGTGKGYYDFLFGNWRFIVLNGNDVSVIANSKGSEKYEKALAMVEALKRVGAPNAQTWNGAPGDEQIKWLRETLARSQQSQEKVILFCHIPVFPKNVHNMFNDDEVLDIIDSYPNIAAYINGHNHAGNYDFRNGVHYLTVKGMVDTKENSYAVIDLYKDSIRVRGYGREINRELVISDRAKIPL